LWPPGSCLDLILDKKGGLPILTVFSILDGVLLRFYVEKLKEKDFSLEFSEAAEDFPGLVALMHNAECRFAGVIKGRVRAFMANDFIEVEGEVTASALMPCGRCLKDVEVPLHSEFALTFASEAPALEPEQEEDVELSPERMGLIPFAGEEIDLREIVQEQVIMELPLRPLCETGCKGLCPQCGANLNEGQCGCSIPVFNNKFSALKGFKATK
jgi:uncharacterized protein